MKNHWLHKQNKPNLVLFFAGWGSSPAYFDEMTARNCDVWMFYDYRLPQLPDDLDDTLLKYNQVVVIGWSFGVWMANHLCLSIKQKLTGAVAINGTLNPVDDMEGIPTAIFNGTLDGLSPRGVEKFNRRMAIEKEHTLNILKAAMHRTFDDVYEELSLFADRLTHADNHIYNRAIVGEQDRIFPAENQLRHWHHQAETVAAGLGHFVFFDLNHWDTLANFHNHDN